MGYHQEYSSMKLGFYLFSEYINMFISSAILATLFFGGYNFPFMDNVAELVGGPNSLWMAIICVMVLLIKVVSFILFFMFIRWTLPRFRYDQLMNLGWKTLVPLALFNMVVTGALMVWLFRTPATTEVAESIKLKETNAIISPPLNEVIVTTP